MVDIVLFVFFFIGSVVGYFRGAFAGVVLLFATYVPFFTFVYFYDFISEFVSGIFANTSDGATAALGSLGAFSGIIAVCGFSGAVFFGTRILLKILKSEQLDLGDKIGGAVVGFIGQNIVATLAFFLIYTAIPTKTSQVVQGSYWVKIARPIHLFAYPHYLAALEARTQKLSISIAQNGVGSTLVGGISLGTGSEGGGFDTPNIGAVKEALSQLSRNIDIDEITSLLQNTDVDDLSAEEIDRRIKEEQAARLKLIQNQLQ